MRDAGELGQRVHDAIAANLDPTLAHPTLASQNECHMVETFLKWKHSSGFQPLEIEKKVESATYEFHGTFDAIGTFGSSPEALILDWKTSSQIDELYGCQLAAYAQAYKEQTGKVILTGAVVRIDKKRPKAAAEVRVFENLPAYFRVFEACLTIWKFVNKK